METKNWTALREYLERSLKFKREARRARLAAGVHDEWADTRIDDSIKMTCLEIAFLDQLIAKDRINEGEQHATEAV